MKLIIGLGNPGPKYEKTRHNLGFCAVDFLRNNLVGFSPWREDKSFNALLSEGTQAGGNPPSSGARDFGEAKEKIILAKPQTFMNLSGKSVAALADFYKIAPEDIWVIHDDMALPLGVLRISKSSGAGGHNGVESIIKALGNKNFIRFRMGIHPLGQTFLSCVFKRFTSTQKFVLQKFGKDETDQIETAKQKTAQAILAALRDGLPAAMNKYN